MLGTLHYNPSQLIYSTMPILKTHFPREIPSPNCFYTFYILKSPNGNARICTFYILNPLQRQRSGLLEQIT